MSWTVETLNSTVDEELGELPADLRARFSRIAFKKTQKTPRREIELALKRAKEVLK